MRKEVAAASFARPVEIEPAGAEAGDNGTGGCSSLDGGGQSGAVGRNLGFGDGRGLVFSDLAPRVREWLRWALLVLRNVRGVLSCSGLALNGLEGGSLRIDRVAFGSCSGWLVMDFDGPVYFLSDEAARRACGDIPD